MKRGLAGMALLQSDLITGIEAADAAGYDVMELWAPSVITFLDGGGTVPQLAARLQGLSLRPISLASVDEVEVPEGPGRKQVVAFARRLCEVARGIGCPWIQVVSGVTYGDQPWPTIRRETARGLRELADILAEYGLAAAYEPLAWRTVWGVRQALEIMEEAGRPNVGLLVDAFHAFAGGDDLEDIRRLDPGIISTVHLGDSLPRQGEVWCDDDRTVMPGDGIVPLRETMGAILATGYDGVVSDEFFPNRYAGWGAGRIARALKAKGDAVLASLRQGAPRA